MDEDQIKWKIADKVHNLCLNAPDSECPSWEQFLDIIESVTDPRQFMPHLDTWPDDANWCAIDRDACALFCQKEPKIEYDLYGAPTWKPTSEVWSVKVIGRHSSPIGVDNFAKISREQMELWEADHTKESQETK